MPKVLDMRLHVRLGFLAVLGAVMLGAVASVAWPHWQAWQHRLTEADIRHAESQLRSFDTPPAGVVVDPSATACHGIGELCVSSDASPQQTLTMLKASVAKLGISLGRSDCSSMTGLLDASCEALGTSGRAKVRALAGAHHNRYWAHPTWVAISVIDPDFQTNEPATTPAARPKFPAESVLPSGWKSSPSCFQNQTTGCPVQIETTGNVKTALDEIAQRLTSLGFGIDNPPIAGDGPSCRPPRNNEPETCALFAFLYTAPNSSAVQTVGVLLRQTATDQVTGRVDVIG